MELTIFFSFVTLVRRRGDIFWSNVIFFLSVTAEHDIIAGFFIPPDKEECLFLTCVLLPPDIVMSLHWRSFPINEVILTKSEKYACPPPRFQYLPKRTRRRAVPYFLPHPKQKKVGASNLDDSSETEGRSFYLVFWIRRSARNEKSPFTRFLGPPEIEFSLPLDTEAVRAVTRWSPPEYRPGRRSRMNGNSVTVER